MNSCPEVKFSDWFWQVLNNERRSETERREIDRVCRVWSESGEWFPQFVTENTICHFYILPRTRRIFQAPPVWWRMFWAAKMLWMNSDSYLSMEDEQKARTDCNTLSSQSEPKSRAQSKEKNHSWKWRFKQKLQFNGWNNIWFCKWISVKISQIVNIYNLIHRGVNKNCVFLSWVSSWDMLHSCCVHLHYGISLCLHL